MRSAVLAAVLIVWAVVTGCANGSSMPVRDCVHQTCGYDEQLAFLGWCEEQVGDYSKPVPEVCNEALDIIEGVMP